MTKPAPALAEAPAVPTPTIAGAAPTAVPRLTLGRLWTIVGLLCFAMMAAYFVRNAPAFAIKLPAFKAMFGLNDTQNGYFLSAFYWSYAFLQLPAGWIVDRFGVKRSLAIGFVFWSLAAA